MSRERGPLCLEVFLLGEFRVVVDGHLLPPIAWKHRRTSDLVKLLALSPSHRLGSERVIDALWPHLPPDAGRAALHKAASQIRSLLGRADAVVLRSGDVLLAPEG